MSCGNPHDMDCRAVIEQVYLYLDGEMADDDCHHIREHLDECSPCLRQFGVEQDIKALIARKCCDTAPTELKVRVLARLQAVRLQIDQTEFRVD
ncbi:MAG: mycothiol system anti-sigma-R factor [Mycobacteriales bacterium]